MQPRPTADELLAVVAEVLEREVVPALSGPVQHHARVAASLVGIVERELRLGPVAAGVERDALAGLLGADACADDGTLDLPALRAQLADALLAGFADSDEAAARVWPVLLSGVRSDLAVVKPGHDGWEGD